jgi:hypothetical protein
LSKQNFAQVQEFAKQKGFSLERHPVKGFRVWCAEYPLDKHANPVQPTLAAAKAFIESQVQKENEVSDV